MNRIGGGFSSIDQIRDQFLSGSSVNNGSSTSDISFEDILKQEQGLKFSKHATLRLNDRNIKLTDSQNERLEKGVEQAREKGIKDSLVLVDSMAFIVNVPNNTVVTAMDQNETKNNVFTNIDGAVIS